MLSNRPDGGHRPTARLEEHSRDQIALAFELNEFIIRGVYRVEVALLLVYLGAHEERSTLEVSALRDDSADRVGRLLTPREREILTMISTGLRNRAIGERLSISEGTVKLHLHHICEKPAADGRLELNLHAQKHGLI